MSSGVFLDRDGVINRVVMRNGRPASPRTIEEFEFESGIKNAVSMLKEGGLPVIVVTNQPDIARGMMARSTLEDMTERIYTSLGIDAIRICPHDDADRCNCRKPKPGMLLEAAAICNVDCSRSFMIGDGWKDMEAGRAAGCVNILLDRPYNRKAACDHRVHGIEEAVQLIFDIYRGFHPGEDKEMSYVESYLKEVHQVVDGVDPSEIDRMIRLLIDLRLNNGRLFFLGVGGGAGNASHAVNDFRKICAIESYTPSDNVSEMSARVNDEGWETVFVNWLKGSKLRESDGLFVFSVGGGDAEKNISANLVHALAYAKQVGAKVFGVVGRNGGYTAKVSDACVVVPTVNPETVTPHTESFQAVIWHLIVSHPEMKMAEMKWESVK
jgi:D-sedoheptulose 7-phosphate isomerase